MEKEKHVMNEAHKLYVELQHSNTNRVITTARLAEREYAISKLEETIALERTMNTSQAEKMRTAIHDSQKTDHGEQSARTERRIRSTAIASF